MNPKNERYPLFCAAMLDLLYLQRGSLSATAGVLGISTGQCGPLFVISKDLMAAANGIRAQFGLKPINTIGQGFVKGQDDERFSFVVSEVFKSGN